MRHITGLAVLVAALALAGGAYGDTAEGPQQAVDKRVATMRQMAGKLNEAYQLSATNASEARAKLADASAIAQSIPSLFPPGTADGDPGVSTRALGKIWTDADGFKAAAQGLVTAIKGIDAKLAANDIAAVEGAFAEMRKACGTCHTDYRGPAK
jgi:cytochrome c556